MKLTGAAILVLCGIEGLAGGPGSLSFSFCGFDVWRGPSMGFLSWLFGGNNPKTVPSAEADPARYNGRPLLLIMENYVLDCIGELPPEKQDAMWMVVKKAFGGGEDWKKTVRQQVDLKDTVDNSIRQMWENNKRIARENNMVLHPVQFAKMFADENFGKV